MEPVPRHRALNSADTFKVETNLSIHSANCHTCNSFLSCHCWALYESHSNPLNTYAVGFNPDHKYRIKLQQLKELLGSINTTFY